MEKNNLVLKNSFAENGQIQIFYDIKDAEKRKVKGEHAQWEKEEPFKVTQLKMDRKNLFATII